MFKVGLVNNPYEVESTQLKHGNTSLIQDLLFVPQDCVRAIFREITFS